jgi:hypothetical protein
VAIGSGTLSDGRTFTLSSGTISYNYVDNTLRDRLGVDDDQ